MQLFDIGANLTHSAFSEDLEGTIAKARTAGVTQIVVTGTTVDETMAAIRIAERFEQMLQRGLLDEVRALRARGDLHAALPSMRCVGYRQAWAALDSSALADFRERGIAATRQLAKRQLTWLRSMEGVTEFDCLSSDVPEMVLEYLRRELEAMIAGG